MELSREKPVSSDVIKHLTPSLIKTTLLCSLAPYNLFMEQNKSEGVEEQNDVV